VIAMKTAPGAQSRTSWLVWWPAIGMMLGTLLSYYW
jgi:hypothetical protein